MEKKHHRFDYVFKQDTNVFIFSSNQLKDLGERLRKNDIPTEQDLLHLGEYRALYLTSLISFFDKISQNHTFSSYAISGRLKNTGTIIEKLKREKSRLHKIQDIAGVRIVLPEECTIVDQDKLIFEVKEKKFFDDIKKINDYRLHDQYGYRAVHIVGNVKEFLLELQVRTLRQHKWAQINERLADEKKFGRGIRYGLDPLNDATITIKGSTLKAMEVMDLMKGLSEDLSDAENTKNPFILNRVDDVFSEIKEVLEQVKTYSDKKPFEKLEEKQCLLVVYDREQKIPTECYCESGNKLIEKWKDLEIQYRKNNSIEIVLLAGNTSSLKVTHQRYFNLPSELV